MRITIAGCGRVGTAIAMQLMKENHDITVIDNNEQNIDQISNSLDVLPVEGDAASAQVLLDAGVNKSDLLIAVTDSDIVNLMICIIAKKIGVEKTIARIREPNYAHTINLIKEDMGLSFAVNPERDAAKEIMNVLMFKGASQVETFAQGNNEVMTFVIRDQNPIAGMLVKDLSRFINRKILICAIKRQNDIFIPNGSVKLEVNDYISFVAKREDAIQFFKKMKYETGRIRDLTIIGGGKLGYYLADMANANGITVRVIDKDPELCRELNERIPGAEIMCGDGTDLAVLEECGVFQSSAVAMTTDSDEKNVLVSMYLSKTHPDIKVITKLKKSDFEDMLYGIDIGNVFNPKYIAADRVITYVRAMTESLENEVQSICHVIDNKVEVLEFKITEMTENLRIPLQKIRFREHLLLASITRNGNSFIPGGDDTIEVGDTILVITTDKGIERFSEIFA
ncbi:MAG: Trk system potassium transporter TrkA [Parasporobacterium sp.]|nr:Trk system potassium transporter TrkA [Parasporobacterium sp.]